MMNATTILPLLPSTLFSLCLSHKTQQVLQAKRREKKDGGGRREREEDHGMGIASLMLFP